MAEQADPKKIDGKAWASTIHSEIKKKVEALVAAKGFARFPFPDLFNIFNIDIFNRFTILLP